MRVVLGVVFAAALAVSACGPSTSDLTGPTYDETFYDTLPLGGFKFHSFPVAAPGTVTITVTPDTTEVVKTGRVGVGVGLLIEAAPGCSVGTAVDVPIGVSTRFDGSSLAGTLCVSMFDIGQMTTAVTYVIRINHP